MVSGNPEELRSHIFQHQVLNRLDAIKRGNARFVHYTNASAAMNMIKSKEIWMRKTSSMNDYSEVRYGVNCLTKAFANSAAGQSLQQAMESIAPGSVKDFKEKFTSWIPHFETNSFVTCISEHLDAEDMNGRLSMWRAYGDDVGIAIVMNNAPFLSPADIRGIWSSPVSYLTEADFEQEIAELASRMMDNHNFLSQEPDRLVTEIFHLFRLSILCTKHPGFAEECEWRVLFTPGFDESDYLVSEIVDIAGVPQKILKIPLVEIPGEDAINIDIPHLVERVIIGPTKYPLEIYDAFVALLSEAGVETAEEKVKLSRIPLRK